jgi:HSP20 family molecular chaperone IbpA
MSWTLNKNVVQEKISVEFKDGILSIKLPIIEEKEKEPIVLKIK